MTERDDRLAAAVALREDGDPERARRQLLALREQYPDDAQVAMQTGWVHDVLGLEREAVPHYEAALTAGLTGDDLSGTLLGLGSTYRSLGRYGDAEATLRRGTMQFPDDRAMRVFHAMALYNVGRAHDAMRAVLRELLETTADEGILDYRPALTEYAEDLDRTWG